MIDRYAAFRQVARELSLDAVAIVPGANFRRLFAQEFHQNERPLVVVIPTQGPPAAVVPNLELGSFALLDFEGEVFDWRDQSGYQAAFDAMHRHLGTQRIGVEGQVMRVFVHHALVQANPNLCVVDAQQAIAALRVHKSSDEIAALRQAIQRSEQALAETIGEVRVGMAETEIESILVQRLFAAGIDDLSFPPIVAAGDNSARPHASARADYAIQPGDALLIDFGGRFDGLCADITRTFFVQHCSDERQAVYATVAKANQVGHTLTHPGTTAHAVDDGVTAVLETSPFCDHIRHKTGHGLGRDIHEDPYIMRGNHQPLEPGMVFTIEPGLYLQNDFGVRIEDDVLVTENGVESLTSFDKSLTLLG